MPKTRRTRVKKAVVTDTTTQQTLTPTEAASVSENPPPAPAELASPQSAEKPRRKYSQLTYMLPVLFLVLALAGGGSYYFYTKYQKTKQLSNNPTASAEKESQTLVARVSKIIELPVGETPTVATVTDVTKLKGQDFFARAQNGDKVLIYQGAKKAILYRPATKKIIEVGPVNIAATQISPTVASASTSATPSPTPTKAQPIKLALYNGTKTNGLTKKAEKELSDKKILVDVVARGNAKADYAQTLIVVLNGTAEQGKAVAQALDGKVAALPEGEEKPESDILVILGKDYAEK